MSNIPEVWLIFLGSFLAFLGSIIVEYIKNKLNWRLLKKNFKLFIKLELLTIGKSLERIKNKLESEKYIDFMAINAAEKSVGNLENSRQDSIYLSDYSQQEKFFDLVADLSVFIIDAKGAQTFYDSQRKLLFGGTLDVGQNQDVLFKDFSDLEKFFSEKRMEKLVELIDIKRRVEDFIKTLEENK